MAIVYAELSDKNKKAMAKYWKHTFNTSKKKHIPNIKYHSLSIEEAKAWQRIIDYWLRKYKYKEK